MTSKPATIHSLRSAPELAADKPHGVRIRYAGGCRCADCRAANTRYELQRAKARKAGDWNGIVPADEARAHMLKLRRQGIGRRSIRACTDIADSVLQQIASGTKRRIRARTARLILQVGKPQAADHALIPAGRTKHLIALLLDEGYTERFLAERLGYRRRYLQFTSNRITVRNAARVTRLYRELTT